MIFQDRFHAANILSEKMQQFKNSDAVIMAIPRGGVPIGYVLSKKLNLPMELLLSKKIGHPGQPEFAIGAVTMENYYLDPQFSAYEKYVKEEVPKLQQNLKKRYREFVGDKKPADIKNKTVIITDDGIATGKTIMVNIDLLRKNGAKQVIIACPVAPPRTVEKLKDQADEVICLYMPENFMGVGQFYMDFSQTTDEEVKALIRELNNFKQQPGRGI